MTMNKDESMWVVYDELVGMPHSVYDSKEGAEQFKSEMWRYEHDGIYKFKIIEVVERSYEKA